MYHTLPTTGNNVIAMAGRVELRSEYLSESNEMAVNVYVVGSSDDFPVATLVKREGRWDVYYEQHETSFINFDAAMSALAANI